MIQAAPAAIDPHKRFARRVAYITLALGIAAALALALLASWRAGAGFAIGAALGWLNFYWLDSGAGAIVSAALAQQGRSQPQVPRRVYAGFVGRYALIAIAAYGTVRFLHTPVLAVFGGLLCLGAAVVAESLYEVFTGSL
jgi:hypothetical protein